MLGKAVRLQEFWFCFYWGGHGGLRYWAFFQAVFSVYFILMCGIALSSSPAVYGLASFWSTAFGKRRPFTVLGYYLFALSFLIQVNTMCSTNNSKLKWFWNTVWPLLTDTSLLRRVRLVSEMPKIIHSLPQWYGHLCKVNNCFCPFGVRIKEGWL